MKKLFLFMLIALGMQGKVCAQENEYRAELKRRQNKAYATFNMVSVGILHRHNIFLEKGNKMIIEAADMADYELLKNFGTILSDLRNNIRFYKDSIAAGNAGNIRIDYTQTVPGTYEQLRFKRYETNGDIFLSKNGNISKLKLDQDTIHLLISHDRDQPINMSDRLTRTLQVQVTLLLNSYTDIDKLIEQKDQLQHFIDTIPRAYDPDRVYGKGARWHLKHTTIYYYPYATGTGDRLRIVYYDADETSYNGLFTSYYDKLGLKLNVGAGLVRNNIAPFSNIGIEYRNYWQKGKKDYQVYSIFISPYFLFNKGGDGKFRTYTNWFINAEIGESQAFNMSGNFKTMTLGLGYLLNPDGTYFQKTTMKAFFNFTFSNGISVAPEVISTNNFKNIWPGISLSYDLDFN